MNDMRSELSERSEALARDVQMLLADVQALLRDIGDGAGVEAGLARAKLGDRLRELQARLDGLRQKGQERVSHWAGKTNRYVHEHPWQCIGTIAAIAAATGALAALAVSRR